MSKSTESAWTKIGLIAACLTLGACNSMGDQPNASLEQSVAGGPSDMQALATLQASGRQGSSRRMTADKAPASAVASLPAEAGSLASVRDHDYVNGFRQDILLKGSAAHGVENGITVLARTSQQSTLDEAAPMFKPTEGAIRSELGRTFPHVSMQVVERPMSNAYGSYGLALGRVGGKVRCVYAWQWIEQSDLKDAGLPGPVTVRVRLCKADTTFDVLADLVNHLTIRRDGANESAADTGVAAPSEPKADTPRKRVASRRVRHAPHPVEQREAAAAPSVVAAVPVVTQPLATDLPPQAYLGPKAVKQN